MRQRHAGRISWGMALALALALAAVGAGPAAAADFGPCGDPAADAAVECATVPVPLDRNDPASGTIGLHVERFRRPADAPPVRRTVVALTGGPGLAATSLRGFYGAVFAGAIVPADAQLVIFDFRGTGRSGALDCPGVQRGGRADDPRLVAECATQLGPRRWSFTTRDSVEDLEAVRAALGAERIGLYGPSYGSQVAGHYALRYPERVERLALDGVLPPEGRDPFTRSSLRRTAAVLRSVCAEGRCAGATDDVVADLRALVARFPAGGALTGHVVDELGRVQERSLRRVDVLLELTSADSDGGRRFRLLPGLVAAAARGDLTPLLRLRALSTRPADAPAPVEQFSWGQYVATTCEDTRWPWDRTAGPQAKREQAAAAAAARPAEEFAPFDRQTALELPALVGCSGWPGRPQPPELGLRGAPDAPALVLAGEDDLRTPLEDAEAMARRLPGATLAVLPATGHVSVLTDATGCAIATLRAFFATAATANLCADKRRQLDVVRRPALSLDEVPPAAGVAGVEARTVTAVRDTVGDAEALATLFGPQLAAGGLRGGFLRTTAEALELVDAEYVPGVRVTGKLSRGDGRPAGTLTVSGRGGTGVLELSPDGSVRGTIDGRPVSSPGAGA